MYPLFADIPREQYLHAVKNRLSIDWTCKDCTETAEVSNE